MESLGESSEHFSKRSRTESDEDVSLCRSNDSDLVSVDGSSCFPMTDEHDDLYAEVCLDKLPASRNGAIAVLNRQIKALQSERKSQSMENTLLKMALSSASHAITSAGLQVPESAKVAFGFYESNRLCCAPPINFPTIAESVESIRSNNPNDLPYKLELCDVPCTAGIKTDVKFDIATTSFPHGILCYLRTAEKHAPHVETRRPIVLTWKLTSRVDPTRICTERDLNPNVSQPRILYRIKLVYADDDSEVTLESLDTTADHIPGLSEPNTIGSAKERMQGGRVTFKIRSLFVHSSMTKPIHRKFKFVIECMDPELRKHQCMHAQTFEFYSVARIRPKEPKEPKNLDIA